MPLRSTRQLTHRGTHEVQICPVRSCLDLFHPRIRRHSKSGFRDCPQPVLDERQHSEPYARPTSVDQTGVGGNRYGHAGDRDGVGADGENPTRFYQWFPCLSLDSVFVGPIDQCRIRFRYRSNLREGETAYVRVGLPGDWSAWRIPDTGGLWRGRFECSTRTVHTSACLWSSGS